MWFLLIYVQLTAIQAQDRIVLRGSSHPCEGRLEVYHNDQWGLVGHHQWTPVNGEVVCKSLGCGDHVKSGILNKNLPPLTNFWMDEIKCKGPENKLWDCDFNGWNITHCQHQNYVSVKCSGNISLSLNLYGMMDECAGVVQFTTPNGKISVCKKNWDVNKANKVCQELNCGKYEKTYTASTLTGKGSSHKVPLNCIGNEDFSWQCVDWVSAKSNTCQEEISIICSNHKRERLHGGADVCEGTLEKEFGGGWADVSCQEGDYNNICAKLRCGRAVSVKPCNESKNTWLKCSDRVKIQLGQSGKKPSPCDGDIYVNVNDTYHAVCTDDTTQSHLKKISEVVCRELHCGTVLSVFQSRPQHQGQSSHVQCHGQEKSLWGCIHKRSTGSCQTIKVICSGSLDMRLSNGLDKCSGQLEVKSFGSWWSVSSVGWLKQNSDMVCRHLECGESKNINQYRFVKSKLSLLQLKLTCTGSDITQCSMEEETNIQQDSVVNITCNKHELWFLQGDSPCEGRVKGETDGYLQTITDERATEVCTRNLCGSLVISTVCPENATSPFSCAMKNTTTSPQPQFAYVKCSGEETAATKPQKVWLQNECYGKVLVCSSETCGVCEDTWMTEQSKMLCKSLGCGQVIRETYTGQKKAGVTVASVHCSQAAENFSQCNFVKLKDASLCQNPAYIACTGSVKAELQDPRDKCAGNLKLFFSGALHSVCTNSISGKTPNVICTNLGCGEAISFKKPISSTSTSRGLTSFTCQDGNISNCDFSNTRVQQCDVGHLKCKGWRRLLLTDHEAACAGEVYLQNEAGLYAVSSDGWSNQESEKLCNYLECGNISENRTVKQGNITFWNRSYSCTGNPNSIWDCEKEKTPVQNHLHINCTDKPDVRIKGNCTGEVQIKNERMCGDSQQTHSVFHELCQDLGCSMFFKSWSTDYKGNARYLSCTGKESKLWQCNSWTDNCEKVISVACKKAIQWKLSSPCGGELQVNYGGQWESVCPLENKNDADKICQDLKCGNANEKLVESIEQGAKTDVGFKCSNDHKYLMHCFELRTKPCRQKAVIYCDNKLEVRLKGNCTGEVQLKNERMCGDSQQTEKTKVFHELCQDLGCSMFFKSWSTNYKGNARYLSCTGKESKLWQCNSWTDNCENVVSVACTKAIQWKLSSPCGGELQVNYRGQWEPVCPLGNKNDSDKICQELKCGKANEKWHGSIDHSANTEVTIKCENEHDSLMHCFKPGACTQKALIYCDKYNPPVKTSQPGTGLIVGVVVGLVLLLVAALIMFWKRKTLLAILGFKSSAEDPDVELSENEMQNLKEKGSASEHDQEDTSEGSSGTEYDDVDDENVKVPADNSPTDQHLPPKPESLLDEVTFDAELEPQEDYDDVLLPQTVVSEQKEASDIPGPLSDPPLLASNDEAKPQNDE